MLNRLSKTAQHLSKVTMAAPKSDITLYTTQTPNGIKISQALEELGYVYPPDSLDGQLLTVCP